MSFTPRALEMVHRYTDGIPRLINLVCDRALLGGYSDRSTRIVPETVRQAARSLDLTAPHRSLLGWIRNRAAALVAATLALLGAGTYGAMTFMR